MGQLVQMRWAIKNARKSDLQVQLLFVLFFQVEHNLIRAEICPPYCFLKLIHPVDLQFNLNLLLKTHFLKVTTEIYIILQRVEFDVATSRRLLDFTLVC